MSLVSGWNLGVMWQSFHTQIYAETRKHMLTLVFLAHVSVNITIASSKIFLALMIWILKLFLRYNRLQQSCLIRFCLHFFYDN